jgi:hypothetical protein
VMSAIIAWRSVRLFSVFFETAYSLNGLTF